jgi:hypothetical protein
MVHTSSALVQGRATVTTPALSGEDGKHLARSVHEPREDCGVLQSRPEGESMRVEKERVDLKLEIPGAVLRQRTDFGDMSGYGKISTEYFVLAAGVDTTPLFMGLEGDLCQCPHWGFVLSGQVTTTDAAGAKETVTANDLFYWPPGHNVKVDKDAELVMFSPQKEHSHVINHMIDKTKG